MVPLIFYSRQRHGAPLDGPVHTHHGMGADQLFMADLSDLMGGKDMTQVLPITRRLLVNRLSRVLDDVVGVDARDGTVAVPLIESISKSDPTQNDIMRGLVVVLPEASYCEHHEVNARSDAFKRRWQKATGKQLSTIADFPELENPGQVLIKHIKQFNEDHYTRGYTWTNSEHASQNLMEAAARLMPQIHSAMAPISTVLQSNLLQGRVEKPRLTPAQAEHRPMIPLLIQAAQGYSTPGVMSEVEEHHHHLWVCDLNDFMGASMREMTDTKLSVMAHRLHDIVGQVFGAGAQGSTSVLPLFEETAPLERELVAGEADPRPDHLRGVMLRVGYLPGCDEHLLPQMAQFVSEKWQKASGAECAMLSQIPEYDLECGRIVNAIRAHVKPGAAQKFRVQPGIEVSGEFDELLVDIQPCVKSSYLYHTVSQAQAASRPGPRI